MLDAYFAGRVFVHCEQDGYRCFLWGCNTLSNRETPGEMVFYTSCAEPADGAFLCKLDNGWLFVAGVNNNQNFRHTFFDDSPRAADNAYEMQEMGIPVLTQVVATKRVNIAKIPLYSITGEERRRATQPNT